MSGKILTGGCALAALAFFTPKAFACTTVFAASGLEMIIGAEMIVRAIAAEYAVPPAHTRFSTTGAPDSKVRFKAIEALRGIVPADFVLPGYLVENDDFNDQPPPYNFVRPGGRSGSCFANSYRSGAQFLLFLKKLPSGDLTVNWYGLGPVNEQLHSEQDPWLLWVREQVSLRRKARSAEPPDRAPLSEVPRIAPGTNSPAPQ